MVVKSLASRQISGARQYAATAIVGTRTDNDVHRQAGARQVWRLRCCARQAYRDRARATSTITATLGSVSVTASSRSADAISSRRRPITASKTL